MQRWTVRLLAAYSDAYARNQFLGLQQFFRWLAAEDGIPDPVARLRPPREARKPVPCFAQRGTFETGEGVPGQLVR